MAIGLSLGRNSPAESIDPCYQAVRSFLRQFSAKYGALSCLDLTGVHLDTPEGQSEFKIKGQINLCTDYVGDSVRLVMDVVDSK
jgi:hypothetical protein